MNKGLSAVLLGLAGYNLLKGSETEVQVTQLSKTVEEVRRKQIQFESDLISVEAKIDKHINEFHQIDPNTITKFIKMKCFYLDISNLHAGFTSNEFRLKFVFDVGDISDVQFLGFLEYTEKGFIRSVCAYKDFELDGWTLCNVNSNAISGDAKSMYFSNLSGTDKSTGDGFIHVLNKNEKEKEYIVAYYNYDERNAFGDCAKGANMDRLKLSIVKRVLDNGIDIPPYYYAKKDETSKLTEDRAWHVWNCFGGATSGGKKYDQPIELKGSFVVFLKTKGIVVPVEFNDVFGQLYYKEKSFNMGKGRCGVNLQKIF